MVEVPLLFESGMEGVFDTTVAVVTSDEVRRERAEARGHALVDEREARQLAQDGEGRPRRARGRERRHASRSWSGSCPPLSRSCGDEAQERGGGACSPAARRSRPVVAAGLVLGLFGKFGDVIQELTLPLRHEDIIRQQAGEKDVDAALIAAVIYAESKFGDQTSSAGARGLMQITPQAAEDIERHSGGTTFELGDLSDPEINIRYGTYLLRELLDRYDGDEVAALAAYNAGPANVDRWGGSELTVDDIPFPKRAPTSKTCSTSSDAYREKYAKELGY